MKWRENLALLELLELSGLEYHDANTQYWSSPERAYEVTENEEDLPQFLSTTTENTKLKTKMILFSKKDNNALKLDNNPSFLLKLSFSPRIKNFYRNL